jgi:large subunit ribosomal protein L9
MIVQITIIIKYSDMKVLFLKNLTGVGEAGQVKDVADGYARNFLLPQNIAVQATKQELKKFDDQISKQEREGAKELSELQDLASKLDGYELDIEARVNDHGTLYAAIGSQKVSQEIKRLGHVVKKTQITLQEPIKEPGIHTAIINFGHGLEAEIVINVIEGV